MEMLIKTDVRGFTTIKNVVIILSVEKDKVFWKIGNDKFQIVLYMNLKAFDFELKRLLRFQKDLKKEMR